MNQERVTKFSQWLETLNTDQLHDLREALERQEQAGRMLPSLRRCTDKQLKTLLANVVDDESD